MTNGIVTSCLSTASHFVNPNRKQQVLINHVFEILILVYNNVCVSQDAASKKRWLT